MSNDDLRMQATVIVDKAVRDLQKLQKEVKDFGKGSNMPKLQQESAKLRGEIGALRSEFSKMVPTFGAIAASGGTVIGTIVAIGAALFGVGSHLREFSRRVVEMRFLRDETGMSINSLKQFEEIGKRLHINPEGFQSGVKAFSRNMFELRKNTGELRTFLHQHGAGGLATDLFNEKDPSKQLERAFDAIESVAKAQGPQAAAILSEQLFGTPDFARFREWRKHLADVKRDMPDFDKVAKDAEEFERVTNNMEKAFSRLGKSVSIELLPPFTKMAQELDKFFSDNKDEIKSGLITFFRFLEEGATRLVTTLREIKAIISFLKEGYDATAGVAKDLPNLAGQGVAGATDAQKKVLDAKRDQLKGLDESMAGLDKESQAYKRLHERREELVRSIKDLEEGLKKLKDGLDKINNGGGGVNLQGGIWPASFSPGGGFRAGGFRGGSFPMGDLSGGGGSHGIKAMDSLLEQKYQGKSIEQIGQGYAEGNKNWINNVASAMGMKPGEVPNLGDASVREKFRDAVSKAEGTGGAGGDGGGQSLGAAQALAIARQHFGQNENVDRAELSSFFRKNGFKVDPAVTRWCATFVNSSLAAAGIKGTGSNIANSFLRWGNKVNSGDVKSGDVLVEHRNRGPDRTGGHVGFATGNSRMRNGRLELEMLGGNQSDSVGNKWVGAGSVAARRAVIDKAMNNEITSRVEGTGKITVDVNGPKGARVKAEGGGIFKDVQINRQPQMAPAAEGPRESLAIDE
jgi:uncharacterized protein (TIGR02594 family)